MTKATLFLLVALATVAVFSNQVTAAEDDDPPMYAVHDFASGQLQQRRTIKANQPCDAEFGTVLEGVVTEMEKNKDANEEMANKLRQQFTDLMEKNGDKNLCEKLTWCDMGVCRKRTKIQNRAAGEGEDKPITKDPTTTKPTTIKKVETNSGPTTTKTTPAPPPGDTTMKSAAAREVKLFFSQAYEWAILTTMAILVPRNL